MTAAGAVLLAWIAFLVARGVFQLVSLLREPSRPFRVPAANLRRDAAVEQRP